MGDAARFRGIVHYVSPSLLIASRGTRLYSSRDGGSSWHGTVSLPASGRWHLVHLGRLGRRAGRAHVWHVLPVDEELWIAIAFGAVFRCYARTGTVERIGTISGSRPLRVCLVERTLLYGEYRKNPRREPVAVWAGNIDTGAWEAVTRLNGIRHVHGVFQDPFSGSVWLTTGDRDSESAIGRLDVGNGTFVPVVSGSQQARAVDLVFTEDAIWFGSDATEDRNHLYRLDRSSEAADRLERVGGPVFYGAAVGGRVLFSTAVEPSTVNRSRYAELWVGDGSGTSWRILRRSAKDVWPKLLFQYGQFLLPKVEGEPNTIWITPLSVRGDQVSIALRL